jgi:hypothetical protein
MKYDDASWHQRGDFPRSLPAAAGATHTGMFVAWALHSGLAGPVHVEVFADELRQLRARQITPGRYFLSVCNGKFTDLDLDERGNAFARDYFDFDSGDYLLDYEAALGGSLPSIYHVPDTWESFDRLKPILDGRFSEWTRGLP